MQRHLIHSGALYTEAGVEDSTSLPKMKELLKDREGQEANFLPFVFPVAPDY